ncbi:hypothetical protein BSKO_07523 [Bryopsis sp. KO-2023]|nr:hypothetical protein BSKO_07523 [Bryopsis sp. KO-2023]
MLSPKQRKLCAAALVLTGGGYAVHRIFWSGKASKSLESYRRLVLAGWNVAEAISCAAELSTRALVDLKEFLDSDDDEIPRSVKQLCKFLRSREVCLAARSLTASVVEGVGNAGLDEDDIQRGMGVVDRLLSRAIDAFLSERGRNLVSLAMSVAARNTVRSLCECLHVGPGRNGGVVVGIGKSRNDSVLGSFVSEIVDALATEKGEKLMGVGISAFARSFVGACMEGMEGVNVAEGIFGAMSRPENAEALKEIAGTSSREAMSSLVKAATRRYAQEPRDAQSPHSVSVNNLDEEGSIPTSSPYPSPRSPITLIPSHPQTSSPSPFSTPAASVSSSWEAPPSKTLQPVVEALVTFCRIPEARDLAVSLAGSAAREGARGVVLSVPEVTSSMFASMGQKFRLDGESGLFSVQGFCTWLVVLMAVVLYMTTRSLSIGT